MCDFQFMDFICVRNRDGNVMIYRRHFVHGLQVSGLSDTILANENQTEENSENIGQY